MPLNWLFYEKTAGWLGLECPTCSNNTIFEGANYQGNMLWKCPKCGNCLSLNLRPIKLAYLDY